MAVPDMVFSIPGIWKMLGEEVCVCVYCRISYITF